MPLRAGQPYELTVDVDLAEGTVEMTVGRERVVKKLSRRIEAIRYYGYSAITTRSKFSAIEVRDR